MAPYRECRMSKAMPGAVALALALTIWWSPGAAQWYAPQSDRDLRLTWVIETIGSSAVRIVGNVQNLSDLPASRVVLRAEGLDQAGRVISRGRGAVAREIPARGSAPFEVRLSPVGKEEKYRVTVELFEFVEPRRGRAESP